MRSSPGVPFCPIERSLQVVGERWTLLVLREAVSGATRFSEFRDALGVAADVLSDRLATLVRAGVLEKRPYQEAGARLRESYHLTPAGEELRLVLGALQEWGDRHLPIEGGPVARAVTRDGVPVHVAFADDACAAHPAPEVEFVRRSPPADWPGRRAQPAATKVAKGLARPSTSSTSASSSPPGP
ncbi:DNA-binding HxlR family transcriptional regulator [Motilibacter peucedani]|uniref:DNA-binding HxlR family transcriptional regulator n=1 Tax=Motilibacter peucedani TaxID=598650 RepID=A0A420XRF4_9ACTN|nr:helix-turn-helix domain-containing protein [Motilibacter peucedani]RKS77399.1 DNA-binding HxlR family transcriptional regulator [Motilibacter peucedani]